MEELKNIHIFTGGKGGTGKTLFSLCTAISFIEDETEVLVVDFNICNPDLYYLLSNAEKPKRLEHPPIEGFSFKRIGTGCVVTPDAGESKNYMLPERGILDFYKKLNTIIDIAHDKDYPHKHVIVDTSFHIANLLINSSDDNQKKQFSN